MLNPFNKSCTIPREFAIATLSYGALATDNECKPTELQHSPRQLTTNLSRQTPQAQASSSGSKLRNIVAACSSSSKRAKKPSGRLDSEGILQRADSAQQTSDSGERLASACGEPKVPITSSKKVSYLRSKGFSLDTCAVENDTFSQFIDLLYDYQDIFAYSATDIPECNLIKCYLTTYLDAKPTRCRPYELSPEMRL